MPPMRTVSKSSKNTKSAVKGKGGKKEVPVTPEKDEEASSSGGSSGSDSDSKSEGSSGEEEDEAKTVVIPLKKKGPPANKKGKMGNLPSKSKNPNSDPSEGEDEDSNLSDDILTGSTKATAQKVTAGKKGANNSKPTPGKKNDSKKKSDPVSDDDEADESEGSEKEASDADDEKPKSKSSSSSTSKSSKKVQKVKESEPEDSDDDEGSKTTASSKGSTKAKPKTPAGPASAKKAAVATPKSGKRAGPKSKTKANVKESDDEEEDKKAEEPSDSEEEPSINTASLRRTLPPTRSRNSPSKSKAQNGERPKRGGGVEEPAAGRSKIKSNIVAGSSKGKSSDKKKKDESPDPDAENEDDEEQDEDVEKEEEDSYVPDEPSESEEVDNGSDEDDDYKTSKRDHKKKGSGKKGNVSKDYVVQKILSKKIENYQVLYLLQWQGFGSEFDTWEPKKNLNCIELIDEFEEQWAAKMEEKHINDPYAVTPGSKRKAGKSSGAGFAKKPRFKKYGIVLDREEDYFDEFCFFCSEGIPPGKKPWTLASKLNNLPFTVYESLDLFCEHYNRATAIATLETKTKDHALCGFCVKNLSTFCQGLQNCVQNLDKDSGLSKTVGDLEDEKKYFITQEEKYNKKKGFKNGSDEITERLSPKRDRKQPDYKAQMDDDSAEESDFEEK